MFHLTLPQLIVVYVFLILGGLFVLWMGGEIIRTGRVRRARRARVVCSVCECHYEDYSDEPLPKCPVCGRANERQPLQPI